MVPDEQLGIVTSPGIRLTLGVDSVADGLPQSREREDVEDRRGQLHIGIWTWANVHPRWVRIRRHRRHRDDARSHHRDPRSHPWAQCSIQ
jgi:hypothetical protein